MADEVDFKSLKANEKSFRIGATHGAQWFRTVARTMVDEGASASEISSRLGDLIEVMQDWRQNATLADETFPEGNPWTWPKETLEDYINAHRSDW